MFQITDKAAEMVREFFKSREKIEPLRIFISGIG
jgi:Fe-S cluster assembly iron-binding protein IscA